jgi:DNA-binding transcriptional LysR family regulator
MRPSFPPDERPKFAEHKHPMFDWNNLHVFLELARQGRLSPTARRLRVDHTTVSRRVAELERSLDQKLFDRTADGFVLTEAGARLQPLAEAIEQQALVIAAGKPAAPAGSVRVASMEGFGSQYVAQYLPSLTASYPELLVELVTSPDLVNLTKREADVSLSFMPPRGPRLQVRQIGSFALFLYAAPAYLAASGTSRKTSPRTDLWTTSRTSYKFPRCFGCMNSFLALGFASALPLCMARRQPPPQGPVWWFSPPSPAKPTRASSRCLNHLCERCGRST